MGSPGLRLLQGKGSKHRTSLSLRLCSPLTGCATEARQSLSLIEYCGLRNSLDAQRRSIHSAPLNPGPCLARPFINIWIPYETATPDWISDDVKRFTKHLFSKTIVAYPAISAHTVHKLPNPSCPQVRKRIECSACGYCLELGSVRILLSHSVTVVEHIISHLSTNRV